MLWVFCGPIVCSLCMGGTKGWKKGWSLDDEINKDVKGVGGGGVDF